MGDDVFSRRWVLAEDELLRLLWRCRAGEDPDAVLVELHALRSSHRDRGVRRGRRRTPPPSRGARRRWHVARHR
ncbi:hypothetical protein [Saccharopolyspora cebuensis]|uniref:Uncharacterized protein n=1 Tax=Saccharopolyspora cebuensis TaxID=418759 RepID=A0ABV4CJI3_9PSEU